VSKPDFDRRAAIEPDGTPSDDPPAEMLFELANSLLYRVRSVARSPSLHPLVMRSSCWRIEYLNDDGKPLDPINGLIRARNGAGRFFTITSLTESIWRESARLPQDFRPKPWESLLLQLIS
jgi:hypothetical protein